MKKQQKVFNMKKLLCAALISWDERFPGFTYIQPFFHVSSSHAFPYKAVSSMYYTLVWQLSINCTMLP